MEINHCHVASVAASRINVVSNLAPDQPLRRILRDTWLSSDAKRSTDRFTHRSSVASNEYDRWSAVTRDVGTCCVDHIREVNWIGVDERPVTR